MSESRNIAGADIVEHASSIEVYLMEPALSHMQLPGLELEGRSDAARVSMDIVGSRIRDIIERHDVHDAEWQRAIDNLQTEFNAFSKDIRLGHVEGITFPTEPTSEKNLSEHYQALADAINISTHAFLTNAILISTDEVPGYIKDVLIPEIEHQVYTSEDAWVSLSFRINNGDLVDFQSNVDCLTNNENAQNALSRISLGLAASALDGKRKDNLLALKGADMDMQTVSRMISRENKRPDAPTL